MISLLIDFIKHIYQRFITSTTTSSGLLNILGILGGDSRLSPLLITMTPLSNLCTPAVYFGSIPWSGAKIPCPIIGILH